MVNRPLCAEMGLSPFFQYYLFFHVLLQVIEHQTSKTQSLDDSSKDHLWKCRVWQINSGGNWRLQAGPANNPELPLVLPARTAQITQFCGSVSHLHLPPLQKSVRRDRSESMLIKYSLSMFSVCLLTSHTEKGILQLFNCILRVPLTKTYSNISPDMGRVKNHQLCKVSKKEWEKLHCGNAHYKISGTFAISWTLPGCLCFLQLPLEISDSQMNSLTITPVIGGKTQCIKAKGFYREKYFVKWFCILTKHFHQCNKREKK